MALAAKFGDALLLTCFSEHKQGQGAAFDFFKVLGSRLFDFSVKNRKRIFLKLVNSKPQAALHIEINALGIRLRMQRKGSLSDAIRFGSLQYISVEGECHVFNRFVVKWLAMTLTRDEHPFTLDSVNIFHSWSCGLLAAALNAGAQKK